jgi:hypothetical protein
MKQIVMNIRNTHKINAGTRFNQKIVNIELESVVKQLFTNWI